MAKSGMISIPFGQFSTEMRSGKIITMDEGFTKLLGYNDEDIKNGLVFKQFVPDVEYNEIIDQLREEFITHVTASYQHEMVTKDGRSLQVVSFFTIQNKLLNGHRVLKVGVSDITSRITKND